MAGANKAFHAVRVKENWVVDDGACDEPFCLSKLINSVVRRAVCLLLRKRLIFE